MKNANGRSEDPPIRGVLNVNEKPAEIRRVDSKQDLRGRSVFPQLRSIFGEPLASQIYVTLTFGQVLFIGF